MKGESSKHSRLKLPQQLSLGVTLPCSFVQCILPLKANDVVFLNMELSSSTLEKGFFLIKEGSQKKQAQLQFALKPGKQVQICVACFAKQVKQSTNFTGKLYVYEEQICHTIYLAYRIEVPKIFSKKNLLTEDKQKVYRIMINKAITSDARVMLQNQQEYALNLQVKLLYPVGIESKDCPFILKVRTPTVVAKEKESFIIFVSLETNIGYKKQFKGMKRCVFRNVLCLKTASQLFYALPLEIIAIFVKEPEIKQS